MKWLIVLIAFMAGITVQAQSDTTQPVRDSLTEERLDTLVFRPQRGGSFAESITNPTDYEERLTQNPTLALFKSMAVPGWGQIGNRSYVKAGVIIGLQAWFIGSAIHFGRQASGFRDDWEASTDISQRNELYDLYDDRRGRRNAFIWYAVLTTFVSMFDAYVDAHLSGRPTAERHRDIAWDIVPDTEGTVWATVSISF